MGIELIAVFSAVIQDVIRWMLYVLSKISIETALVNEL